MKLASILINETEKIGLISEDRVYPLSDLGEGLPETMNELLVNWDKIFPGLSTISNEIKTSSKLKSRGIPVSEVIWLAPVPRPASLRDGYAFRQHVETARRNRGLEMTDVFDSFPVFFSEITIPSAAPDQSFVCRIITENWILNWKLLLLFPGKEKISVQRMQMNTSPDS